MRDGGPAEICANKIDSRANKEKKSVELFVIGVLMMPFGSLTIFVVAFAVVGALWGRARIRARRRWRSAIDSFARLQMTHESRTQVPQREAVTG